MDNWKNDNNKNNDNQDVTVSGQFHAEGQFRDSYDSNAYSQGNYGAPNMSGPGGMPNGPYANSPGGYGQPYANYNQPPYQGPGYPMTEKEEPIGVGEWTGLLAIASFIPCIGLILVIVWAFSKTEKKSKSNFCKAYLIICLIRLAISMIFFIIYGAALIAILGEL